MMIGTKVKHKIFGTGTITSIDKPYIFIEFAIGEKEFLYPDAFESFITAEDPEIQRRMIKEIQDERDAEAKEEKSKKPPISTTGSRDTFIFKDKEITYEGTSGYVVCDLAGLEVGVVWSHWQKPGQLSEGQAEIRFFDEFKFIYNTWRLVFINRQRLYFSELEKKIKDQGSVTLKIDPRRAR